MPVSKATIAVASRVEDFLRLADFKNGNRPTVDSIASDLLLSKRTLQRRLKDEGTSFSEIIERVIVDRIIDLRKTEASVLSLSRVTGFIDRTSLSVFCSRNFGINPRKLLTEYSDAVLQEAYAIQKDVRNRVAE